MYINQTQNYKLNKNRQKTYEVWVRQSSRKIRGTTKSIDCFLIELRRLLAQGWSHPHSIDCTLKKQALIKKML